MKKMIWFTSFSVFFAVFVLPGFLALFIKYVPYNFQPPLENVKGIYGMFTVSQEFVSQETNLTGIAMTIKNPNLKNKKDFFLELYDDKGQRIRDIKFNGLNVEDGSYIKFLFDPITDSRNKAYRFVLSNPSAGEEELLGIYYTRSKPDWVGNLMFDEESAEGGISLVTFHKPADKFDVVKGIYSSLFSRLLSPRSQKSG